MPNCKNCKETKAKARDIPYIVHESAMARSEREHRRLFIALVVAVVMIVASNITWLLYVSQYDFEEITSTYTQDGIGVNIMGSGNGVDYSGAEASSEAESAEA